MRGPAKTTPHKALSVKPSSSRPLQLTDTKEKVGTGEISWSSDNKV